MDVWNIYDKKDGDAKLLNQTNNGLERYNRHFNGICLHLLMRCAQKLTGLCNVWMMWQREGRSVPDYSEPCFPDIPHDFYQEKQPGKPKVEKVAKKGRSRK